MKRLAAFCVLATLLCFTSARAQTTFTVHGTVTESMIPEYETDDTIIFTLTLAAPSLSVTSSGPDYFWYDGDAAQIFSSITFTGATGTYASSGTFNTIALYESNSLFGLDSADSGGIGLLVGSETVIMLSLLGTLVDSPFNFTEDEVTTAYFDAYPGVYDLTPLPTSTSRIGFLSENYVDLDITKVEITTVPEPSALFLAGATLVGWALIRRRHVNIGMV